MSDSLTAALLESLKNAVQQILSLSSDIDLSEYEAVIARAEGKS